jgi:hypothetical protein
MMAYYGMYQHERGSVTTWNGKTLDRIHKFKHRANRDAWVANYPKACAISRHEAEVFAQKCYNLKLNELSWIYDDESDELMLEAETGLLGTEHETYRLGRS